MCASCATYDHSRNCGDKCSDHAYEVDKKVTEAWGEGTDVMYRCPRCGSCKWEDTADVAS